MDLTDGYDDVTSVPSAFLLEANLGWQGGSRALLSAKLLTNLNVGKACLSIVV